ncbi:unnamed protein product [Pelagomonas calceolata]|uniref:Uncharacterized protein n=1 Tax=Pelagomonas calceolata TaxID=35677 RepID=A0A8J2SXP8_9STRA|nr:unnamed protein product [Pelagomonas calceolata]
MLTQALLIALAASVDAAYLRASESRRLAGHGGDHDDNGSLGGCTNDPDWHHKNRGPEYDCAWVAGAARPLAARARPRGSSASGSD